MAIEQAISPTEVRQVIDYFSASISKSGAKAAFLGSFDPYLTPEQNSSTDQERLHLTVLLDTDPLSEAKHAAMLQNAEIKYSHLQADTKKLAVHILNINQYGIQTIENAKRALHLEEATILFFNNSTRYSPSL